MKKRTLLYIPLALLFVLSLIVLFQQGIRVYGDLSRLINPSQSVRFSFGIGQNDVITELAPETAAAGMQIGDILIAVNGREIKDKFSILPEELYKTPVGEKITYTVERKTETNETIRRDFTVETMPLRLSFGQALTSFSITLIFLFLLPATSFLLGFYVAFQRPRDALAWVLLMLLLGIGSVALEGWDLGTLPKFFQQTWMNPLGIWMLLFGVYFPERFSLDRRFPFIKWIFIAPVAILAVANLFEQIGNIFGWKWLPDAINEFTEPFDSLGTVLTMLGMSSFFALLGYKSATLKNKDSRRRLRILYVGTSLAMLPAFFIVLYRLISGKQGGFFELVPAWYAIFSLLMMLLFPLTMAYVIVVQRAMDVGVVIRQGLQYALATGGVRVLQLIMLLGIGLGVLWTIRNYGQNVSAQIAFIVGGIALVPLIDSVAKRLRVWIDRRFFREAYNAELILSELSEDVRTMVETKPLLETVSTRISESLHVPQVALLLKNGNNDFQPAYALGYENVPNASLSENTKTIERLKKNEPLVIYQDDAESWINEEAHSGERADIRALNSQLLLPVGAKDRLSGVISLSPKLSEEPYTPNDLRLLKSVAAQTGLALENSWLTEAIATEAAQRERLNREVEIAREVQERLFPQELPPIAGLDYYGACRPALGVGGDYYDFLELPDNKFGIAIGDVSGKGIGASLMMASLQASLRGQAIHCQNDLAELMKHVNTLLYDASTSNRYATFFYAQYDRKTRKLIYVNAGHNPPFLIRRSAGISARNERESANNQANDFEITKLEEGGAVVGMLPSMFVNYKQGEIELQSGDLLVGFTDGISEAMNPEEEEWGEDAMLEELKKVYEKPSAEILPYIVAEADKFANGAKQHDDMTMIVVKII